MFNPDNWNPEHTGWQTLTEWLFDTAGFIRKPSDPTGLWRDEEVQQMSAKEYEDEVSARLAEDGEYVLQVYRERMARYRTQVRMAVQKWRNSGKL